MGGVSGGVSGQLWGAGKGLVSNLYLPGMLRSVHVPVLAFVIWQVKISSSMLPGCKLTLVTSRSSLDAFHLCFNITCL